MTQSERSKTVAIQAGWINYQKMFMEIPEDQIRVDVPQQFRDIFLIGYALGEERAAKRGK